MKAFLRLYGRFRTDTMIQLLYVASLLALLDSAFGSTLGYSGIKLDTSTMSCKDIYVLQKKMYRSAISGERKSSAIGPQINISEYDVETPLPCVEINQCKDSIDHDYGYTQGTYNFKTGNNRGHVFFDTFASGQGEGPSLSIVEACWRRDFGIVFNLRLSNQSIFISDPSYSDCNSAIYNLNIAEIFVAPYHEDEIINGPKCYNEIDINPSNAIYQSGIYNNNGTLSHSLYDCNTSSIIHNAVSRPTLRIWGGSVQIPWKVLNNPSGCPTLTMKDKEDYQNIYRINFYRISETDLLTKQEDPYTCTDDVCNYYAWSPTLKYPPSFHVPSKFGYLILK